MLDQPGEHFENNTKLHCDPGPPGHAVLWISDTEDVLSLGAPWDIHVGEVGLQNAGAHNSSGKLSSHSLNHGALDAHF